MSPLMWKILPGTKASTLFKRETDSNGNTSKKAFDIHLQRLHVIIERSLDFAIKFQLKNTRMESLEKKNTEDQR